MLSNSINEEYFRLFDIAVTEEVIVMEPQLCVHTIIDMGEKGELDIHSLSPILDYIRKREYEPTGMIRGEILARVHEKNDWHRFLEVKIPIIKN